MTFSSQSTSLDCQELIQSKLGAQRKSGYLVMSPPFGKKFVVFIDDINMPSKDQYDVQSTIELLRQMQDKKGSYDRTSHIW